MHYPKRLLPWHLYHGVSLDYVIFLKVVEFLKYKTALIACRYFLNVILETL